MKDDIVYIFLHLAKTGGSTFHGHLYRHLEWDREFVHLGPWGQRYRERNNRQPFRRRSADDRNRVRVLGGHRAYYGIHTLVPDKTPRYITFVRCPAELIVSRYNYSMSRREEPVPFCQVFNNLQPDPMIRFYYQRRNRYAMFGSEVEAALNTRLGEFPLWLQARRCWRRLRADPMRQLRVSKSILNKCYYVGITGQLDQDLTLLFSDMGLPTTWKNYRVAGDPESSFQEISCEAEERTKKFLTLKEGLKDKIYEKNQLDGQLYRYACEINQSRRQAIDAPSANPR